MHMQECKKKGLSMKQAFNPYLPSYEYVPDGEPHVFGDRLYIFGSHDAFNGRAYCENDYVAWSAPVDDLADWRYEGVIYKKEQDPTNKNRKKNMWAPDVTQGPDGRFYLYYAHEFVNRVAVAVCDSPAGSYEYYGEVHYADGTRYGNRGKELLRFDPGVLTDDDGRVYLYTGFGMKNLFSKLSPILLHAYIKGTGNQVAELEADMLTIKSEPKLMIPGVDNSIGTGFEGHEFYEASSIRKFNGKYYFIYSSILSHELAYAVSDYPDRDFAYQGSLLSNADIGFAGNTSAKTYWGNNHGSVEYINGKYYIFGHRQTNKTENSRQGIAEELHVNADGRFEMAELTSCGLNGGPLVCEGLYEARIACHLSAKGGATKITVRNADMPYFTQDGDDREDNPNQYIANMKDGALAAFKYFNVEKPEYKMTITISAHGAQAAQGYMQISNMEDFEDILAEFKYNGREKKDISSVVNLPYGKQPIYFRYVGQGAVNFYSFSYE